MMHRYLRQHGFAAVAAIFLVVVLAALGGYMMTFTNAQQLTSAQDVQGTRAYWAARAGLEWAIATQGAGTTACWAGAAPAEVDGFALTITCTSSTYADGADTLNIFRLTSRASMGALGTVGFVERELSASVER